MQEQASTEAFTNTKYQHFRPTGLWEWRVAFWTQQPMSAKSKSGRVLLGADSFPQAEVWGPTHRFVLNLFQKILLFSLEQTNADAGPASSTRASRTMDVGINILHKFTST